MAIETTNRTATGFILGAVVVVLVGVVWYLYTDGNFFGSNDSTITIKLPEVVE